MAEWKKTTENTIPSGGTESQPEAVKKARRGRKRVREFLGGDYLSREWVVGNLPYLLFITILAILFIGNTYYAEKTFKETEHTKAELKELRYRFITTKSALIFQSTQSEISKRARVLGLQETAFPPYKILYSGKKQVIKR